MWNRLQIRWVLYGTSCGRDITCLDKWGMDWLWYRYFNGWWWLSLRSFYVYPSEFRSWHSLFCQAFSLSFILLSLSIARQEAWLRSWTFWRLGTHNFACGMEDSYLSVQRWSLWPWSVWLAFQIAQLALLSFYYTRWTNLDVPSKRVLQDYTCQRNPCHKVDIQTFWKQSLTR